MISVPLINPLRYTSYGYSNNFNTKYFDLFQYPYTLRNFEEPKPYFQPFNLDDPYVIYLVTGDDLATVTANFYDCDGALVYQEALSVAFGYTIPNEDLLLTAFTGIIDLNNVGEGKYSVRITDGLTTIESNKIEIKDSHDGTVLIKYRNSKFYEDVIFEKLASDFYFYIRIQGYVKHNLPERSGTTYEDQVLNMTNLKNIAYNSWSYITDSEGIPDYMIDLINRVFGCNDLSIDGRAFTVPQDSKWEEKAEEFYPLRGWGIDLREKVLRSSIDFSGSSGSGSTPPPIDSKKELFSDWWVTTPGQTKLAGSATSAIWSIRIDQIDEIKECDRDGRQYDPVDTTPSGRQYKHNTSTDEVEFDPNIQFGQDPDGNPETVFLLFTKK